MFDFSEKLKNSNVHHLSSARKYKWIVQCDRKPKLKIEKQRNLKIFNQANYITYIMMIRVCIKRKECFKNELRNLAKIMIFSKNNLLQIVLEQYQSNSTCLNRTYSVIMQEHVLKCLHENHYSKSIIGVCVNPECQKMRPYCQQCLKCYLHSDHLHDLHDFTDFFNFVQEGLNRYQKLQNLAEELQSIAKLITIIINQLSFNPKINLKDMSIIAINNLINNIIRVIEVEKSLKTNLELALQPLQKIKQDFKDLLQKNSEVLLIREEQPKKQTQKSKKQKKVDKVSQKKTSSKQNQSQAIAITPHTKQEEFKHQIICIKNQKQKEERKQQQQQQFPSLQGKFQFSNVYKNRAINVITNENSAEGFGFCICDQAIQKNGSTIIAFRIVKCDWRVHIGVCDRDTVVQQKYDPNLSNLGHGTYLISNQGDVYSDIDKENNDVQKSFKFCTKNIITLEVDFTSSQVKWIKKQPNEAFTMNLNLDKELYPCVKLWGASKVELLNPVVLQ